MTRVHLAFFVGALSVFGVSSALAATKTGATPSSAALNQASVLLGYGFDDVYHFSIGARGLHQMTQLPIPITLGGSINYYFGSSTDLPAGLGGSSPSVKSFTLLGEVGYPIQDLGLPVMLRPYIGLGLFSASVTTGTGTSASNNEFCFAPGVVGEYNVTPMIFVGGDVRLNVVSNATSLALFGLAGVRF